MREFLIDTHILIWYTENDIVLSADLIALIEDSQTTVYVSIVSFYEIAIKLKIGKLEMSKNFKQLYKQTMDANITILPITESHLNQYIKLPLYPQHKDPFDRLIIATAMAHNFTIVSADKNFNLYNDLVEIVF